MGECVRELPNLIVALDANNTLRYVHIREINENNRHDEYLCPICMNKILPRSIKESNQMQRHFYHEKGDKCNESYTHWLYKNYLFDSGSKFMIKGKEYEVQSIELEKRFDTSFGTYIPDIAVLTKDNKTIFFEINFTNEKKQNDYISKWRELGNTVVEVDIKELINNSMTTDSIPNFTLVFDNGICYKPEYKKRDTYYNNVGKRIEELTRQEILNYKSRCESLDWFWTDLSKLKQMKISEDGLLETYSYLNVEDMEFCFNMIKKEKFITTELFRDKLNNCIKLYFYNIINTYKEKLNDKYILTEVYSEKETIGVSIQSKVKFNFFNCNPYYDNYFIHSKKWSFTTEDIKDIESYIINKIDKLLIHYDCINYINNYFNEFKYPLLKNGIIDNEGKRYSSNINYNYKNELIDDISFYIKIFNEKYINNLTFDYGGSEVIIDKRIQSYCKRKRTSTNNIFTIKHNDNKCKISINKKHVSYWDSSLRYEFILTYYFKNKIVDDDYIIFNVDNDKVYKKYSRDEFKINHPRDSIIFNIDDFFKELKDNIYDIVADKFIEINKSNEIHNIIYEYYNSKDFNDVIQKLNEYLNVTYCIKEMEVFVHEEMGFMNSIVVSFYDYFNKKSKFEITVNTIKKTNDILNYLISKSDKKLKKDIELIEKIKIINACYYNDEFKGAICKFKKYIGEDYYISGFNTYIDDNLINIKFYNGIDYITIKIDCELCKKYINDNIDIYCHILNEFESNIKDYKNQLIKFNEIYKYINTFCKYSNDNWDFKININVLTITMFYKFRNYEKSRYNDIILDSKDFINDVDYQNSIKKILKHEMIKLIDNCKNYYNFKYSDIRLLEVKK